MVVGQELSAATIDAMKSMASDPLKRAALVKDDVCLGGLVMVLSNKNNDIVKGALETLCLLAETADHRHHMKNFIGMMDQLSILVTRQSPSVRELATRVHRLLVDGNESFNTSSGVLRDTSNHRPTSSRAPQKKHMGLFGTPMNKYKVVVLQITGLKGKEDIEACRTQLLKIKGVVSITFDQQKKRSILRTKKELKPELLAGAVSKTETMTAQQVIKDDTGNEVLVSFGKAAADQNKENCVKMPDYPPDDDDTDYSGHPANFGQKQPDQSSSWNYVKKLGSFLSNSLYW